MPMASLSLLFQHQNSSFSRPSLHLRSKHQPLPNPFKSPIANLKFRSKPYLKPLKASSKPLCFLNSIPKQKQQNHDSISHSFHSLNAIKPYVLSNYKPILCGWFCSLVSVISLSQLVSRIGKFSAAIGNADVETLRSNGLVLGGLFLVKLVSTFGQQVFLWDAALRSVYELRVGVFGRVLDRELGFFEGGSGISAGDIAYRVTAEAADVSDTLYALLNTIVPSTLQLSAMATQMLAISPLLSLMSALVIPCVTLATALLGAKLRKISRKAHLSIATLSAYLNEVLPAILFVKSNNAEQCEVTRFKKLAHADLSARFNKMRMKALIPPIIQIVYFGALFTLCIGSMVISSGCFNPCAMVSFLTSLVFLVEPIQDVGKAYNEWKQGEPAIERLFDLTKLKSKVIDKPDAIEMEKVQGDVKFCDVSFKYEENMPLVLNGLNLHIKAGQVIALVGPSGGGKTTLIKLLLRLYEPFSGSIFVDNHNIQDIRLKGLRQHIGLVSQDIALFSGTVAENIGYRDLFTNINMEKVKLAAKIANADEFIRKLPRGYETNVGPRGSSLSGGQKQRIAIARAVYQDSSILILDEATSALDSRSELLVRQALKRIMEDHTVLVIAHRLETVMMADRVFHLDGGKLEELTHSTLLATQRDPAFLAGLVI